MKCFRGVGVAGTPAWSNALRYALVDGSSATTSAGELGGRTEGGRESAAGRPATGMVGAAGAVAEDVEPTVGRPRSTPPPRPAASSTRAPTTTHARYERWRWRPPRSAIIATLPLEGCPAVPGHSTTRGCSLAAPSLPPDVLNHQPTPAVPAGVRRRPPGRFTRDPRQPPGVIDGTGGQQLLLIRPERLLRNRDPRRAQGLQISELSEGAASARTARSCSRSAAGSAASTTSGATSRRPPDR